MSKSPGARLRSLLARDGMIVAPGAFDGLSAHLARRAGFEIVYASGGAISRSLGFPDVGLLTMTEMATQIARIAEAAEVPVIADADTGYGGPTSVWRTVRAYRQAGAAGVHIEDQTSPKRCGHLDGKSLILPGEMAEKVRAAKEAAEGETVIIARTDAIAVEGFDSALERARLYAEAGADMLFVEAPQSLEQIRVIGELLVPKLLNMFSGGKTPHVPAAELAKLGYKVVIVPSDLQRAVILAMETVLAAIRADGDSAAVAHLLAPLHRRDEVVEAESFSLREAGFAERRE